MNMILHVTVRKNVPHKLKVVSQDLYIGYILYQVYRTTQHLGLILIGQKLLINVLQQ